MTTHPVTTIPANTMPNAFVCVQAVNNPNLMSNPRPTEMDMEYVSTIMLPMRGQFVKAVTTFDKNEQRWITSFWWMWLSVNKFTHKWIVGDPVKTGNTAWLRKDTSTKFANGTLVAHDDAVQYFIKCATANVVPAATYMGKDIPNLFGPSRFEYDVKMDDGKQQPHNPIDDILNMIQKNNIKSLYATQEDIEAMKNNTYLQSDNYALGA